MVSNEKIEGLLRVLLGIQLVSFVFMVFMVTYVINLLEILLGVR